MLNKTTDEQRDTLRIIEIDALFGAAVGWGSWVVEAANEREAIVNRLRALCHNISHRYQARTSGGHRVD